MADENKVTTIIEWVDAGTGEVIRASNAVKDSVESTTDAINDASGALDGLKDGVSSIPQMSLPTMPLPFDEQEVKDAGKALETAGKSTVELGKAGEQLSSVLDSAIPGLGGIAESLMSMNPVAIAGTAALTGLVLIFGDLQRQAEETRKAAEALVKAEQERVISQLDITQRVNLALEGNKAARESVIKDLAANVAAATSLSAQQVSLEEQRLKAEQDLVDAKKQMEEALNNLNLFDQSNLDAADKAFNDANARIDEATKKLEELSPQIATNTTEFQQLTDASKKLGITAEENAAVMKSVTTGAEGATQALDKLWGSSEDLAKTADSIGNTLKKLGGDILDFSAEQAKKAEEAAKERAEAEERLIDINKELTDVETDRGKALADRAVEDQRSATLAKLNDHLVAAQAYDAQQTRNKKIAEIQDQGHQADIEAQQKYMEDELKLLDSYRRAEKEATQDYSRDRLRQVEDLYNTLLDLSSKRDVAGFVNARRAGMTDIARGDEDAGIDAQRRRAQYEQSAQDLQSAFAKENAQRHAQLQQRLQQEADAGKQEFSMAAAVQKQIAALREQYAAQDLRARRMSEDTSYRQTVDILQRKRTDELKITAGTAAGVIDIFSRLRDSVVRTASAVGQAGARGIPKFDTGTPYVERTGLAILHQGERVMTAADNARYMRSGAAGGMGNLTINMTVGEIATPSQIAAVEERIVSAFERFGGNSN